jgi:uncharacterized membrane protein
MIAALLVVWLIVGFGTALFVEQFIHAGEE